MIISAFMHEAGHIIACFALKLKPKIKVSVFGIKLSNFSGKRILKFIVLISGPLVNLILVLICAFFLHNKFSLNKYIFMSINMIMFGFNMLPIHFLDGGQIIQLLCDNNILRNILDIIGFLFVAIIIINFSGNICLSLVALTLFIIYYMVNKIGLHIL